MGRRRRTQTRKKVKRMVPQGKVFIHATFNNTIVTITDRNGNTIAWGSAGNSGFKGSRKSTPYAAGLAGRSAAQTAQEHGMQECEVVVKGPGPGRERSPFVGAVAGRWR